MLQVVRAGLRIALALGATAGAYLIITQIMRSPFQPPVLGGALVLAVGLERAWALLRWLSPLHGKFGDPDQEQGVIRALDRELSRSLRFQAPLVVVALRGKRSLSARQIEAQLRLSDIVIRGRNGNIMVVMTETRLDQAEVVMRRMAEQLPVMALAMADEAAAASFGATGSFGQRHLVERGAQGRSQALVRALQLGIFRARSRARRGEPAPIYLISPADVLTANSTANDQSMADFTQRVA